MEENNDKKVDTDELLKETTETFNQVKDQVKDSFKKEELKNSAEQTKGFIVGMFKDPLGELKTIAEDGTSAFKYAVILVIVWMVARAIRTVIGVSWTFNIFGSFLFPLIKTLLVPVLSVLVLSGIIFVANKKKDKSLVTILSVVTAAYLPMVISAVANILRIFSLNISTITAPFASLCSIITTVLLYFGIKELLGENDDKKFIKTFVIIEAIYYIAYIILGFLGIYII